MEKEEQSLLVIEEQKGDVPLHRQFLCCCCTGFCCTLSIGLIILGAMVSTNLVVDAQNQLSQISIPVS